MHKVKALKVLGLGAGLMFAMNAAQAKQVMCVFDLVGKNGDV